MVTINHIAKLAGVSTATVSNVINNKLGKISDGTRDRVLQIIKEEGYIPNRVASSMVTKQTKTIGLIIPDISNPFFPDLARGVEDFASENDYTVILCNSDNKLDKEETYIEMLQEKMVDGIIIAASRSRTTVSGELLNSRVPIVSIDRKIAELDDDAQVIVDNEEGVFQAVTYLLKKGYRNICHLSGPIELKTAKDRYSGFLRAYKEAGIEPMASHLHAGSYTTDWGYEISSQILSDRTDIDCFTCGNDLIALGVYRTLHERGLKVAEDIAVVGYDDIYVSNVVSPGLTTIRQPSYQMGYRAAETLINKIRTGQFIKYTLPLRAELIIRESTK